MPVIGVGWPKAEYLGALRRAGGEIRELRPEDRLPEALDSCDGVLLTGGADVDPREYGNEARHSTVTTVDPARDRYELELTRLVLAREVPLLAICRGVQVLNVAAGGTLVQDLPSMRPSPVAHKPGGDPTALAHPISVVPDSRLHSLLATRLRTDGTVDVNSRHHQAVRDLAPGFVATATAPDEVIEAMERPGAAFCLGVQWHPENFWETGEFNALFDALIEASARRR